MPPCRGPPCRLLQNSHRSTTGLLRRDPIQRTKWNIISWHCTQTISFYWKCPAWKTKELAPVLWKGDYLQLCVLATVHWSFKLFNVLSCLYFSGWLLWLVFDPCLITWVVQLCHLICSYYSLITNQLGMMLPFYLVSSVFTFFIFFFFLFCLDLFWKLFCFIFQMFLSTHF